MTALNLKKILKANKKVKYKVFNKEIFALYVQDLFLRNKVMHNQILNIRFQQYAKMIPFKKMRNFIYNSKKNRNSQNHRLIIKLNNLIQKIYKVFVYKIAMEIFIFIMRNV